MCEMPRMFPRAAREEARPCPLEQRTVGKSRRTGMTLLELLGFIAVFAVVVNLAAAALLSSTRLSLAGKTA